MAYCWKIRCAPKLKHFLWQVTTGYLATAKQLKERHCAKESICVRCGDENESINHTIFECPPALQCWALSDIPSSPGLFPSNSIYSNIDFLLFRAKETGVRSEVLAAFPWIVWYIWKARNEKIFKDKDITPLDSLQLAVKEAESWTLAQRIPEDTEGERDEQRRTRHSASIQELPAARWRCQTDASWINERDSRDGLRTAGGRHTDSIWNTGTTCHRIPTPRRSRRATVGDAGSAEAWNQSGTF